MGTRLPWTPNSKIRAALRVLTLRCRERNTAMKAAHYTCERCGAKQSVAKGREVKVQGHHRRGIIWDDVCSFIRERVFQTPADWECLCEACHAKETERQRATHDRKQEAPNHNVTAKGG